MFRFVSSILRIPVKNLHRKRLMDDFLEIQRNRLFFWCPSSGILEKKFSPFLILTSNFNFREKGRSGLERFRTSAPSGQTLKLAVVEVTAE